MKRLRKVFECDRAVYLEAKQKAEDDGLLFSRLIENAIRSAVTSEKTTSEKTTSEKTTSKKTTSEKTTKCNVLFWCEPELYARAKEQAHREGVYLARWLERQLGKQ